MNYREIYHYGIKRRSGRYPWGSGNRPFQRTTFEERKNESLKNVRKYAYVKNLKQYLESSQIEGKPADYYTDLSYERLIKKRKYML